MSNEHINCGNCHHVFDSRKKGDVHGSYVCRRYPPTVKIVTQQLAGPPIMGMAVQPKSGHVSFYPPVNINMVCGEFSKKEA